MSSIQDNSSVTRQQGRLAKFQNVRNMKRRDFIRNSVGMVGYGAGMSINKQDLKKLHKEEPLFDFEVNFGLQGKDPKEQKEVLKSDLKKRLEVVVRESIDTVLTVVFATNLGAAFKNQAIINDIDKKIDKVNREI